MNYEKYSEVIIPPEANLKLPTNNNSRYFYNNKIKELVLDVIFNTESGNKPREFELKLPDPLIIDIEHDIFLDTVVTYNLKSSKMPNNMAFLLKIDQFNIQTKSATNIIKGDDITNRINNSIMIPNEKAFEQTEQLEPTATSFQNSAGSTIDLPGSALGASSVFENYYKGFTILIHIQNPSSSTLSATVTASSKSLTPQLTLSEMTVLIGELDLSNASVINAMNGSPSTINVELFEEHINHSTIHKGRKHNYVGTITPCKLMNLTGSVSDMGSPTFTGTLDGKISNIIYDNPFRDGVVSGIEADHRDLERLIVEFKLVPRQ
tara:strand:- start:4368 stop:5330 length:963 start_codon:yes stop_codon:yes gene_type:complete